MEGRFEEGGDNMIKLFAWLLIAAGVGGVILLVLALLWEKWRDRLENDKRFYF